MRFEEAFKTGNTKIFDCWDSSIVTDLWCEMYAERNGIEKELSLNDLPWGLWSIGMQSVRCSLLGQYHLDKRTLGQGLKILGQLQLWRIVGKSRLPCPSYRKRNQFIGQDLVHHIFRQKRDWQQTWSHQPKHRSSNILVAMPIEYWEAQIDKHHVF